MGFIVRVWWRRSSWSHVCLTDLRRLVSVLSRESFVDSFWFQLLLYVRSTFQCLSTWVCVAKVNLHSRRRLSVLSFYRPASFPQLLKIKRNSRLWTRTPSLISFRRLLVRLLQSFFRWHLSSLVFFFSLRFLARWIFPSLWLAPVTFSCQHDSLMPLRVSLLCKGVIVCNRFVWLVSREK